jgi:hypothetical protein
VYFLPDRFQGKQDWHALEVPMQVGASSSGLFSIALREGSQLIAAGGDYKLESDPGVAFGFSARPSQGPVLIYGQRELEHFANFGNEQVLQQHRTIPMPWGQFEFEAIQVFEGNPFGYRSAVACAPVPNPACVATGPQGTDILPPMERSKTKQRPPYPIPDSVPPPIDPLADPARWQLGSATGYDSVSIAGRVAWFSGDEGRLGRAELPSPP